jgi:hypothetical protein
VSQHPSERRLVWHEVAPPSPFTCETCVLVHSNASGELYYDREQRTLWRWEAKGPPGGTWYYTNPARDCA